MRNRNQKPRFPWNPETLFSVTVFAVAVAYFFVYWNGPARAWVHPELLNIGQHIWSGEISAERLLSTLFDWPLFDSSPHRIRIVSDAFEMIDALTRPFFAEVYLHPSLSVSFLVFVVATPILSYRTVRLYNISAAIAILSCALLLSTPGFMSNAFAYIRPAKPISFVILSSTLVFMSVYIQREERRSLYFLSLSFLVGFFTDELLYFTPIFSGLCIFAIKPRFMDWRALAAHLAPFLVFVVLAFFVLPILYGWIGPHGPRIVTLTDPQTGSLPFKQMLAYLWSGDFVVTALRVTARSLAAQFGMYRFQELAFSVIGGVLVIASMALLLLQRGREDPAWRLAALALFGFVSFSAYSTWLDWYNGPHANEDYGASTYYYHSPISLFFVLMVAAAIHLTSSRLTLKKRRWVSLVFGGCGVAVLTVVNIHAFLPLNDIVRVVHIGPTDSEKFFRTADGRTGPPTLFITGVPAQLDETFDHFSALGREVMGSHWEHSSMYRRREDFEHMAWWDNPTYGQFARRYLGGLCVLFHGKQSCPITIMDYGMPSQ